MKYLIKLLAIISHIKIFKKSPQLKDYKKAYTHTWWAPYTPTKTPTYNHQPAKFHHHWTYTIVFQSSHNRYNGQNYPHCRYEPLRRPVYTLFILGFGIVGIFIFLVIKSIFFIHLLCNLALFWFCKGMGSATWVLWSLFGSSHTWIYANGLIRNSEAFLSRFFSRHSGDPHIYHIWIFNDLKVSLLRYSYPHSNSKIH